MTEHDLHKHVEISDGERTVATADVTTPQDTEGTVRASLRAEAGHIPPGSRTRLVDAVMDLPEVQEGGRLEAAVPLGDGESLDRLRERSEDASTHPAGATALLDANIPSGSASSTAQDAAGEMPAEG